jgi:hypothetical protein
LEQAFGCRGLLCVCVRGVFNSFFFLALFGRMLFGSFWCMTRCTCLVCECVRGGCCSWSISRCTELSYRRSGLSYHSKACYYQFAHIDALRY